MLKLDDTWGGIGVARADSEAEVERLFEAMRRPIGTPRMIKRLLIDRDPFPLPLWFGRVSQRLNAQAYVEGRPANCLAACWRGEVLAILGVEVVRASSDGGPATIVRVTNHPDMEDAARRIVGRLGLSGFCGFDFVVDDPSSAFHLIEMNQRMTPIGHLSLGDGQDPVAALTSRALGVPVPVRARTTDETLIALFPSAWLTAPDDPMLSTAFHDVPWSQPDLVRELVRPAWQERGTLVRLYQWFRRYFPSTRLGG
jgi:hypothetical protein